MRVPDDNIVNYTVTIVPTDGGSPTTVIVGGDKNSTEIEGLQPNTNYTVTVRAVTPDGEGDPTSIAVTTELGERNTDGIHIAIHNAAYFSL